LAIEQRNAHADTFSTSGARLSRAEAGCSIELRVPRRSDDVNALIQSGTIETVRMTYPAGNRRSISAEGFARLLDALHADPDQAAHEYERLRRALVKFFDWRAVPAPDECADETLDRLARKLEDTAVKDVKKYVHGIARFVAMERRRAPAFTSISDTPLDSIAASPPVEADEGDALRDCFDRCLDKLPEESRSLILRYYEGERDAKIANRRRLASALGLTENALRSRVQRVRDRLERCMQACASQPLGHTP
jgi:DNA-directed RNA polymerase specialized sigma24 family protein